MKIGFFDSGLGGLTILKSVAAALPQYDYVYYGDTKHLPYGDKSEAMVYELSKAAMQYLFEQDCGVVIIACNTASAQTLRRLQDDWLPLHYPTRRILGVIVPTIEAIVENQSPSVILLATKRTIDSGKYQQELHKCNAAHVAIVPVATPALVPLLEAGELSTATQAAIAAIEGTGVTEGGVILGCTHYTLLKGGLREHFGPTFNIFSQDEIIPHKLKEYLQHHPEISNLLTTGGERVIHLTKDRPDYETIATTLLTKG